MKKIAILSCCVFLTACQPVQTNDPNAPPLVKSTRQQIGVTTSYDPSYRKLDFPMGDVPKDTGVCADVIIRAYRNLDGSQRKDLQQLINSDMKKAWQAYPKRWGLKQPDPNIDHRRVPNLEVFFSRYGKSLSLSDKNSFQAGDIVTWRIPQNGGKFPHIGIISDKKTISGTPLIIHNIGRGTEESDILYQFPISGHFRYA
ncbi:MULTISPECIES: DUF1287 domain-containing protein [unclassified Acinetobacter]|uniref:DUF1287 domain-containing protein n=1 Tax=unclassified Acinetobacter TaxID=196816 RepID=UPI0035B74A81